MEGILDLYAEAGDPSEPVVCVDERPYPLIADTVPSLPARPGVPRREDSTYPRRGVCQLWIVLCPRQGWRAVEVTRQRTKADFARLLKHRADE